VLHRESILVELEKRMTQVTGVSFVARNPEADPGINDLPCINIFEMADRVMETHGRGGAPVYKREIQIVLETFIKGTKEAKSTKELMAFLKLVKVKLYEVPAGLGGLVYRIREDEFSRVHRPGIGDHVAGIGMALTLVYVEDTSNY